MLDSQFRDEYRQETLEFRKKFSKTGCVVSAVLIFFGFFLDFSFFPNKQTEFFLIRTLFAALSIIIFFAIHSNKLNEYVVPLTLSWLSLPQIMIAYMICDTTGAASIYVFGLSLALFASGIIIPINIFEVIFFGISTIILYIIACLGNGFQNFYIMSFYGNLTFLSFGVIISTSCTYFNESSRFDFFKLQKEVAEKNEQLKTSNQQLAEIKGFAIDQEKMSALGTLSAGLLHEVNNPVNYSLMAINMSLADPAVKTGSLLREGLVDAKDGMMRVQAIVSDLKIFAYQKPGPVDHRVFLFENVINSAKRLTSFETKGVEIKVDMPQDTHVLGDEPALIGVMINLITNATMAMVKSKQANPTIHIKGFHKDGRLNITTRDNGTGIEPQNISKVFEPFFTTRDVGKGLGLGLAVCYAVIQRHDSLLTVESQLGEWTQFAFDLEAPTHNQSAGTFVVANIKKVHL
jgi:two-component system, sensor histidine kinase PhcS